MDLPGFSEPYEAPAKLNLMLRVVGRRADGYHLLQTVFRFIDRADTLRFRLRADGAITRVNDIAGVPADSDLCVRAARALKAAAGTPLGVDIHLEKHLPMGGGLGGGSSDAATTLLVLNKLWKCALTKTQLLDLGEKIGADVPVFVFGDNAFAEGIGTTLQPLQLPPAWYVVLCPPVMVPTAAIFADPELKRDSKIVRIQGFFEGSSGSLKINELVNDLQAVVVRQYPEVARHLEWLSQQVGQQMGRQVSPQMSRQGPALMTGSGACMTGSGACVFAAFALEAQARQVLEAMPAGMQGFVARGLERHPLHDL